MIRIHWNDRPLSVRRLVVGSEARVLLGKRLESLAVRHELTVSDAATEPQAGDLWLWCQPPSELGLVNPEQIGEVRDEQIYLALARLHWSMSNTPLETALARVYAATSA